MTNINPMMNVALNTTCTALGDLSNASLDMIDKNPDQASLALVATSLSVLSARVSNGYPGNKMLAVVAGFLATVPYGIELANVRFCGAKDDLAATLPKIDDFYSNVPQRAWAQFQEGSSQASSIVQEGFSQASSMVSELYQQYIN